MKPRCSTLLLLLPAWLGCSAGLPQFPLDPGGGEAAESEFLDLDRELASPLAPIDLGAAAVQVAEPLKDQERIQAQPIRSTGPVPLSIEGTFVPSGWMGDAENPGGPLKYEVCRSPVASQPTCEKWIYSPPVSGEIGWIAVAYQAPSNNWGMKKGIDLAGKGFRQLSFLARGERGGERIVVGSGGHTSAGAAHPASYEATIGVITLEQAWKRFDIPLDGDLSNTCCVLSFTINRAMAPSGCTVYLDDIELRGPSEQ